MTVHGMSSSVLSYADKLAANWSDALLLAGRILFAWLFLASGYGAFNNVAATAAYFTSLGMSPAVPLAWFTAIFELVLAAALVLGFATRYAALASFAWVLITILIAHRYWTYPAAQQGAQYIQFLKNLSIMGGALYVFVVGAGRYAVDARLARR